MFNYHLLTSFFLTMFLSIVILMGPCQAQITTDGTLGPAQNLPGPDYQITSDLGTTRGNNLFHSFGEFNIHQGERATFTGPDHIANIIGRVTGGYISTIDGTLISRIPNANFYFLNPYGVFMGPNAKLEIDGAFHLSSTDSLKFADGYQFDAYTAKPLLTVAAPERFGFLNQIGNIRIEGNQLENGDKDFSVTAGNLQIVNSNITSTTQDGQAGNILLQAAGSIEIRSSGIGSTTLNGQAGNITLNSQTVGIGEGSLVGTLTLGAGNGGKVQITAQQLITDNSAILANTQGTGLGGDLVLNVELLELRNNSRISTTSQAQGQSGKINITATNSVTILGNQQQETLSTAIDADASAQGNGGDIILSSPVLYIDAGILRAVAKKESEGNAGNIELKIDRLVLKNGGRVNVSTVGKGQAGNITITGLSNKEVDTIEIVGYLGDKPSGIASSTFSEGDSGTIDISAKTIHLNQRGTIQTQSLEKSSGKAGDIILNVQNLTIKQGADIDASNEGTNPEKGGNITINADTILITADQLNEEDKNKPFAHNGFLGGIYSVTNTDGEGGDIDLTANQLELRDGGVISAKSEESKDSKGGLGNKGGFGNAGRLKLSITDNLRMNNAAIITSAEKAGGGNIEIGTPHEIHLINSKITAKAGGERRQDHGGNLTIHNLGIFTLDSSQLLANAYAGNGGDINLETPQFKVLGDSQIDVSSELGFNGELILNSTKLRDDFLILAPPGFQGIGLSLDRCVGLTRDDLSQFIITIRDVLPPSPTDLKTHYFFP